MARDVSTLNIEVTAEDKASGVITRLAGVLKDRFVVTLGDVTEGLRRMTEAFARPIELASQQEDAIKRLSNALSDQGASAARHLTEALIEQAEALQKTTRFSNDAIEAGQAFAAAFIKNGDALKGVTQSAVDLATGLGIDLQTAFELLTRAAQGQTQTLARYGLILDDNIPKGEKLAALQGVIAERFGGRAQADVKTYGGALAQLGNAWEDLLKAIGEAVVKNNAIVDSIRSLTEGVVAAIPRVADFAKAVVDTGTAALPTAEQINTLSSALVSLGTRVVPAVSASMSIFKEVIVGVSEKIVEVMDVFGLVAPALVKGVEGTEAAGAAMNRFGKTVGVVNQNLTAAKPTIEAASSSFSTLARAADSTAAPVSALGAGMAAVAPAAAQGAEAVDQFTHSLLLTGEGLAAQILQINQVKAAYASLAESVQTAAQKITGANDSMLGPLDQPGDPLPSNLGRSRGGASAILTYGQAYSQQVGGLVRTTKIANTITGGNVARTYTVFGVLPDGKVFPLGTQVIGPDGTILSGQQFG